MAKKRVVDYRILYVVVSLIVIGIGMIYSASGTVAGYKYNDPSFFVKRQLVWVLVGFAVMFVTMRFDYRKLEKLAPFLYISSMLMLFAVLIPGIGKEVGGARRWLDLGSFTFQPSELAKLTLIIFFAAFLVKKERVGRLKDFMTGFVPNAMALGVFFLLILLQPDLGTSVIISIVIFTLFFVSGIRFSYIVGTFVFMLPFFYVAVLNVDYRRKRIMSFLDPWADPSDSGFQIIQSYVAFGNGYISGLGLGNSNQKNFYLPDAHTDFIFSIIGEETGFLGCLVIIALFLAFIYLGLQVAFRAPDNFGMYLAVGITLSIGLQAAVNMGVASGLLPTKGLPLPFISVGGSALVMWMASVGVLLNVSEHTT